MCGLLEGWVACYRNVRLARGIGGLIERCVARGMGGLLKMDVKVSWMGG
jgi:hypothetical protein